MTDHDDLRAVLRRVTTGALVEWAGEAADMDDIREAADAVADTLAMLDWRTLLGVPPAPEPPSGGEVTADELAEVMRRTDDQALVRTNFGQISATYDETAAAILARFDVRRRRKPAHHGAALRGGDDQ